MEQCTTDNYLSNKLMYADDYEKHDYDRILVISGLFPIAAIFLQDCNKAKCLHYVTNKPADDNAEIIQTCWVIHLALGVAMENPVKPVANNDNMRYSWHTPLPSCDVCVR